VRDVTGPAGCGRRLRVTVFCGAAPVSAHYLHAAAATGRLLADHDIDIVYGGGRLGLMGALADAALEAGGHVTGILPGFLHTPAIAHSGLSALHIVSDMAARKAQLVDAADAILALPGGFGTLDELATSWEGIAFGTRVRPIGLLNVGGFYDPLRAFIRRAAAEGFLTHHAGLPLDDLLICDDDPARLLQSVISRTVPETGQGGGHQEGALRAPEQVIMAG